MSTLFIFSYEFLVSAIALIVLVYGIYKRWDSYTGKKPFDENDWWNKNNDSGGWE